MASIMTDNYRLDSIALADPMKRILMDVWGFTEQQLWGPSDMRNTPDPRFPLEDGTFLTPRKSLQALDSLRVADPDCWLRRCWRDCQDMLDPLSGRSYDRTQGMKTAPPPRQPLLGLVVTDVRFPREADFLREKGCKLVLVERHIKQLPSFNTRHPSDQGLLGWGHDKFDAVIRSSSLQGLPSLVHETVQSLFVEVRK